MINLESVLPELERAVEDRVESKVLARLGDVELRDLVYQLVQRKRANAVDISKYFEELVSDASEKHSDFVTARDFSVIVRTDLLTRLLDVLKPALPGLVGPIVIKTTRSGNEHEKYVHHRTLCGFELLGGAKEGKVTPDLIQRSGRSWWIVARQVEDHPMGLVVPVEPIEASYGILEHGGVIRRSPGGTWQGETLDIVSKMSPEQAARQIRDDKFVEVLRLLHKRLVSLAAGKIAKTTDSLWKTARAIERAVQALENPE